MKTCKKIKDIHVKTVKNWVSKWILNLKIETRLMLKGKNGEILKQQMSIDNIITTNTSYFCSA